MIIYGTKGAHVRTEPLSTQSCPGCGTFGALRQSVFSRYAHIYWIPLFPIGKPTVVACGNCQQAWEEKGLPEQIRPEAQALKKQTRAPLHHFAGLFLIGVAGAWGLIASSQNDRANVGYLAAPRAGDIYTVRAKDGDRDYSLLKVIRAKGNSVELVSNEYQINDSHPLDKLNSPEKYSNESFSLTQFELQIMKNKGQLTDVDRLGE